MNNLFETLAEATRPESVAPRREIKFRGKGIQADQWFEGYFSKNDADEYFIQNEQGAWEVYPGTVGQYTGLKDKNGVEIYEGDVLQGDNSVVYSVHFDKGAFLVSVEALFLGDSSGSFLIPYKLGDCQLSSISVIGNRHDNPELLP